MRVLRTSVTIFAVMGLSMALLAGVPAGLVTGSARWGLQVGASAAPSS